MIKLHKQMQGFTLIELSIVIVIIGILMGGIVLGGQVLHASKITKLSSEISEISRAFLMFQETYNAFPGDYNGPGSTNLKKNGVVDTTPTCSDTTPYPYQDYSIWPAICPGNANGFLAGGESNYARNHVVYDGFLPIQYTQRDLAVTETVDNNTKVWGTFPTKVGGIDASSNNFFWLYREHVNPNSAPTPDQVTFNSERFNGIEMYFPSPKIAFEIDQKLDDGKPLSGKVGKPWWDWPCYNPTGSATDADASTAESTYQSYPINSDVGKCILFYDLSN